MFRITIILLFILFIVYSTFIFCYLCDCKIKKESFLGELSQNDKPINLSFEEQDLSNHQQKIRKQNKEDLERLEKRYEDIQSYESKYLLNKEKQTHNHELKLQDKKNELKQVEESLQKEQNKLNTQQQKMYEQRLELQKSRQNFDSIKTNCTVAKSNCEQSCNSNDSNCLTHCSYHYNICKTY